MNKNKDNCINISKQYFLRQENFKTI